MRARVSGATTISTTAAAIANQNAHACRRPLSRGSGDSTRCTLTRRSGLAHCAAHAEQHLVVRDALELAPAWQLGPAVAVVADLVLELGAHDNGAGARLVGDTAREIDWGAEPVTAAREAVAARDAGT